MRFRSVVDQSGRLLLKSKNDARLDEVSRQPGNMLVNSYPPDDERLWKWDGSNWQPDTAKEQEIEDRENQKQQMIDDAIQAFVDNKNIIESAPVLTNQQHIILNSNFLKIFKGIFAIFRNV